MLPAEVKLPVTIALFISDTAHRTMTTRSTVTRLISAIPVDTLRPHANFGATLTSRIDSFTQADVAALQNLTSNRYKQQVMTTRGDSYSGFERG